MRNIEKWVRKATTKEIRDAIQCQGCPAKQECKKKEEGCAQAFREWALKYGNKPRPVMQMQNVEQECRYCGKTVHMMWPLITEGYEAICPYCGQILMLCSECRLHACEICNIDKTKCDAMACKNCKECSKYEDYFAADEIIFDEDRCRYKNQCKVKEQEADYICKLGCCWECDWDEEKEFCARRRKTREQD